MLSFRVILLLGIMTFGATLKAQCVGDCNRDYNTYLSSLMYGRYLCQSSTNAWASECYYLAADYYWYCGSLTDVNIQGLCYQYQYAWYSFCASEELARFTQCENDYFFAKSNLDQMLENCLSCCANPPACNMAARKTFILFRPDSSPSPPCQPFANSSGRTLSAPTSLF